MKRIIYILCAAATLLTAFTGCQKKAEQGTMKIIDLRYRANDNYELEATDARSFEIMVASSDPWTISSDHPEWCIIEQEQGEGVNPDSLRIGHAPITSVRIQYYDNPELDSRTDHITIQSEFWVGKVINVYQKGIAFLTVDEADLDQDVVKAGGQYTIHVSSNQNWSAKVTEGEWLSIASGATGSLDGDVILAASDNSTEKRYGSVTIFDRHNEAMYIAKFTQDGIQLVPAKSELRADYNQESISVDLASNTNWVVVKEAEGDDWYTIENPSGNGDGTVTIKLTPNDDESVRKAQFIIKNVVENEGDYLAEKTIVLKQAYKVTPVRHYLDNDEMTLWKSDQLNTPVYTKDVGTYFNYPCRLNSGDMPMGTYTFCWKDIQTDPAKADAARARHWFCFGESAEIKCDLRPFDDGGKVGFSFNAAGDGNKPSPASIYGMDFSQPVEFTIKFEPNGVYYTDPESGETTEYCHVQFYVNGVAGSSFDTSREMFRSCYWGAKINLYFGMYNCGSGICEWYEYSAPINWD